MQTIRGTVAFVYERCFSATVDAQMWSVFAVPTYVISTKLGELEYSSITADERWKGKVVELDVELKHFIAIGPIQLFPYWKVLAVRQA